MTQIRIFHPQSLFSQIPHPIIIISLAKFNLINFILNSYTRQLIELDWFMIIVINPSVIAVINLNAMIIAWFLWIFH